MKIKWMALGIGIGGLIVGLVAISAWTLTSTYTQLTSLAQNKVNEVRTAVRAECVHTARSLLNVDTWLSNPPSENFKMLKNACAAGATEEKTAPSEV